jgi:hypothetical protein
MYRQLLLVLLLAGLCKNVNGQRRYNADKLRSHTIILPEPLSAQAKSFSLITVADKRFDTGKAGFISDGDRQRILLLNRGVQDEVQHYLSKHTQNNDGLPQLLYVLRTLWLHELKAGELKVDEDEDEKKIITQCVAKIEVFLVKEDSCQALLRIDTIAQQQSFLRVSGAGMVAGILDESLKKIRQLDLENHVFRKTKIAFGDLMKLYDQRTAAPRLRSDSLQRGVYLTFSDFLQNTPKPYTFVLEQDEVGDFLYLEENGNQRLFTNFWGFCDGKMHFIKVGGSFFPLVRDGNAYSFYGCLQPIHNAKPRSRNRVARYALFGVFGDVHSNRLVNFLRPMQVDMETGKVY